MKKVLSKTQQTALLTTLQARFEQHPQRHPNISWKDLSYQLKQAPEKLWSLQAMEDSDGAPDVIAHDPVTGEFLFVDCSPESPQSRVSTCYDRAGLESRKDHPPAHNAADTAAAMGVTLITEAQYLALQSVGPFDLKTSSWLLTPAPIRALGGALYGERRYQRIFIGHNGAQSYYNTRGFRTCLRV